MTVQGIAEALRTASAAMAETGDPIRARQARELTSKLTEGRLTVALCGHFSAGKSTLVNRLCGAQLLPSSPIPTSANVVSIRGGERAYAEVEKVTEDGTTIQAEVPIGELDQYCVDGEQYTSVSIVYPSELLGDKTVLLDTPGIDSTDAAHRMSTESALHLADVVFYVMDYNHVQSEINFAFAKELKDWGKPLYFIVNQIDKHRDRELSFSEYRNSVEEAFQAWHLEPAGILYLSLRKPEHPHHEWHKLIGLIGRLAEQREELCAYSVDASLRHLAETHLKWREECQEPERERLIAEAGGEEAMAAVSGELQELRARIDNLAAQQEVYRTKLRVELQSLLDNANITPAPLRDLAHAFLESRKPGFKTGLLFAGAKTAAEQERRLEAFRAELSSLVSASIEWHVKQLLRKAAESASYNQEKLEANLASELSWTPDGNWLIGRVKAGAVMGNEYTMTFSKDLAADIKSVYRQRALDVIDELAVSASAASEAERAEAERRLAEVQSQAKAIHELESMTEKLELDAAGMRRMLPAPITAPVLPKPAAAESLTPTNSGDTSAQPDGSAAVKGAHAQATSAASRPDTEHPASQVAATLEAGVHLSREAAPGASKEAVRSKQGEAAGKLIQAAELISGQAALRSAALAMREKAERLQSSRFTVALFGAFSAGKSSLANALIGDAVLPVSPNPTTAAINRLMPPTAEYGHGEARVVMKSREAVLADLRYSLALLGEQASEAQMPDAASILKAIDKLTPQSIGAGGRPHYSFLRAARQGWEQHEQLLGKELKTDRAEYARYVAEESRSCFVSEIDFHYECALTAEGIVLVDTPGADSVNARHTGVAFNYIKNADAVLFVTYYNHAFSQADRQFLDQLGRVKDQFELDKMFFVVNAADLAADEEELEGVLAHVEANLLQHAIRSPRLFPVSSIEALDGKMDADQGLQSRSRMPQLESAFLSFITNDLGRLAVESAYQELARTIGTVSGWVRGAEGDASQREAQLRQLDDAARQSEALVDTMAESDIPQGLKQEINELLYYVIQRLQYRFGEFYHLAYNPASLQDDGRDLRRVVWTSWLELQRLMQRELSQELLATTLRMERALHAALKKQYDRCSDELTALLADYLPAPYPAENVQTPQQAKDWEAEDMDAKWLWSRFKSPRQFFEGEGKTKLRKELETLIAPELQRWMDGVIADWTVHYERVWQEAAGQAGGYLKKDMVAFADGKRATLTDSGQLEELKKLHAKLAAIQA
ncbi:dynamin family protein [Paenibacillus sp. 1011MAR3C5]|uniref:dynamin family protein n=1 Tax=Paenibacillus sp. 1011MAR3C5 TaxID=1675787 RepID=UPI002175E3D5|nr:dynamin family protein [Paenibacillus sp. 1011MAR3C5]